LILTVNEEFREVIDLIGEKRKLDYPINNIGFVGRKELHRQYMSSEFFIFPSLTESFGLGLIEAVECGCKVLGADLPYTYEVCQPSIVFNPLDDESFMKAFENSLSRNIKISFPKIKNNINELIDILEANHAIN
jgi:glycosyltransferase involved in cell wall biosynthesis